MTKPGSASAGRAGVWCASAACACPADGRHAAPPGSTGDEGVVEVLCLVDGGCQVLGLRRDGWLLQFEDREGFGACSRSRSARMRGPCAAARSHATMRLSRRAGTSTASTSRRSQAFASHTDRGRRTGAAP
jgi:hypothetical protein